MNEAFETLIDEFRKLARDYPQIKSLDCKREGEFAFQCGKRACHWIMHDQNQLSVYYLEDGSSAEDDNPYCTYRLDGRKAMMPGTIAEKEVPLLDLADSGLRFVLEKPNYRDHQG